ncbi:hypothetical protein SKC41_31425 [Mycobacterium sp. 050128]
MLGRWFWWPQVVHPRGSDNTARRWRQPQHTQDADDAETPVA